MSLLIIGDSHVIRLRRSLSYDIPVKKCQWVSGKCDWEHVLQAGGVSDTVYFSAHRGRNAWTSKKVLEEINPCLKDIANEGVEVAAAFGYIDAKIQLVRYKDAKETVKKYVDGFLNFFPNNKVTFIEPLPQFINNLGTGPDIYDFKDRYPMHKEFVHYLNEYLFDNHFYLLMLDTLLQDYLYLMQLYYLTYLTY